MCNCGNKRNDISTHPSYQLSDAEKLSGPTKKMWEDALFEYTGKSALTVKGGITGKTYRFIQTGDTKIIDYRDASGMMGVPRLKKIKKKD